MTSHRPRIAAVTHFYPSAAEPHRGLAVYHELLSLALWADVEVFCVHPKYPRGRFFQPRTFPYKSAADASTSTTLPVRFISYPVFPAVSRPFNGRICSSRLTPHLKRMQPDVILAYFAYPDGHAAVLTGNRLGIPVVVEALGSDLRRVRNPWLRYLVARTLREATFVITVSQELRDRALAFGARPERVQTVRGGCDNGVFHLADRSDARAQLGLSDDIELILFVGRFVEVKGLHELFTALPRIAARRPRVELACIGEGPLEQELRLCAGREGVEGRVRFLGSLKPREVARWLAASNLLCLPSHSEGLPNVVAEALACGRPVVASEVGGIPEMVDPSCGILTSPRDPARLTDALEMCLAKKWDEQLIASKSQRSWKDAAAEVFQICLRVLRENGGYVPDSDTSLALGRP